MREGQSSPISPSADRFQTSPLSPSNADRFQVAPIPSRTNIQPNAPTPRPVTMSSFEMSQLLTDLNRTQTVVRVNQPQQQFSSNQDQVNQLIQEMTKPQSGQKKKRNNERKTQRKEKKIRFLTCF